MSAYALPGSFFFPSTATVSNDDAVKSKTDQAASEADTQESWSNDLLISIKSASIDHIRLIQGLAFAGRRASTSSRRSIRDRMASLSNSLTGFSLSSSMTESDEHWGEYGYEDNDNDNDAEEESVEEESGGKRKPHFNFDEMDNSSPRSSVTDVPVCAASVTGDFAIPASDSSARTNAQDDAIQFTLSISFNGRKYTATRALPTFVKLRNDLMLELANRKKSSVRFQTKYECPREESSDVFYESKEHEAHEDEVDVVIPELPIGGNRMNDDGKSVGLIGMAGRGFRGLHDTVKQYCPPMEDWIQSVAALVPSSPTLANFLFEPLQNNQDVTFEDMNATSTATAASPSSKPPPPPSSNGKNMRNSFRNSIQTLNSITEFAGFESENEDEDEGEGDNVFIDDGKEEFLP